MTRPRVLITESIADQGVGLLEEGGVDVDVRTGLQHDELVKIVGEYDGLIVRSATTVDSAVLDAADKLTVVGRAGTGVDNVDVDAATRRGILVVNAPQSNSISTAEHTVALLLSLARHIPQAHRSVTEGKWERSKFIGTELHDKVLGVIGLGRIGALVAQRCLAFGMRVVACDPYMSVDRAGRLGIELIPQDGPNPPDELLARADVITIHVPKTRENLHMLGDAEFAKCKDGVLILNVARGGLVDEDALARAVASGKVGGAALDVYQEEPLGDSPLRALDGVVLTPHLAGSTVEAQDKAGISIAEQVLLAMRGELVPNAVNVEAGSQLPDFVRAYLPLAAKLGRLASALAGSGASELEVSYEGRIAEEDTRVLTLAALRGFLQPGVHEPVTFVNAPLLAQDRGLTYAERKSPSSDEYLNLLRVTAGSAAVAGTLAGRRNEARLVEIDGRPLEISLTQHMAFFRYEDRPGVVHSISGPLAEGSINIGNMVVAKPEEAGQPAIMALSVDSPVPPDVFDSMMRSAGIPSGRFVSFGDQ